MAVKKISRKDIAHMSAMDFMRASWMPYKRLFSYLKPYKGRFALGIFFGALYGILNGALVLTVRAVAEVIFPSDGEASPFEQIGGGGENGVGFEQVALACAMVPLVMLLRGLFSYLNIYCMLTVSLNVLRDIRRGLFTRLMSQSLEFFNQSKSGDLIQTVFNQTRMAQMALTTVASDVIKQPISIISALAVLFWLDWKFTLAAFLIFPLCLVPVIVVGRKVRKTGAREEQEAGQLMVVMQEAFAGVRVVKSYSREEHELERFTNANQKMLNFIKRWQKAMEIVGPMVETVASFGVALALVYAWYFNLGPATFLALNGGLILLYPPFKTLSRIHILMQKCLAATTKVFELMDRDPAIQNLPEARPMVVQKGEIVFDNVTFSYGADIPAVQNISFTIPPGSTCALVGPSGAGKSTLFGLMLRFYEPDEGRILIDGQDIREVTQESLRQHIGIVNQDTFLFHDSILQNILYGRLEASPEEAREAARQAYAHDFIEAQPDGYETIVGDKGCLLSGGQQQRLAIARALLKNAPILLLDEATSALDSESERQIQSALEKLSSGKTVVAIAHRLSTILQADQIVVLENGQIRQLGRHEELLQTEGPYRTLYELQFGRAGVAR